MSTQSKNLTEFNSQAPDFVLPDTRNDQTVSLKEYKNMPLVVAFVCNHCPYVIRIHDKMCQIGNDCVKKNVAFVAISSNDAVGYPDDAPHKLKEKALRYNYQFPYLYDEEQKIAKAYDAACTPEFFVYDGSHALIYNGQFDDSRPNNNIPVTGHDLLQAIEYAVSGKTIDFPIKPAMGCGIKWKS